jgi:hypothetical protein
MYEMLIVIGESLKRVLDVCISVLYKPVGFYLVWILLHYLSVHIYTKVCVPLSLWGFISSPFIVMNPLCGGLEWIIHNSLIIISSMWAALGTWITTNVLFTTYNSMRDNIIK